MFYREYKKILNHLSFELFIHGTKIFGHNNRVLRVTLHACKVVSGKVLAKLVIRY